MKPYIVPGRLIRALLAILAGLACFGCVLTEAALTDQASPTPPQPWQTAQASQAAANTSTAPPRPAAATPAPVVCVVTGTQGKPLNIRSRPGLIWPVLGVLTLGQTVEINPGAGWHSLTSGGYISAKYCEVIK